jgi:protein PhnA
MTIEQTLLERSGSSCELCGSEPDLSVYEVPPVAESRAERCVLLCNTCRDQVENPDNMDVNHWRCLNDSMWNQEPAVQVMAWRMLDRLKAEGWPQDLLDMLYLEDDVQQWAEAEKSSEEDDGNDSQPTLDSNGTALQDGDAVTLIKDLVVKGAGFTAKRGTVVKNISLTSNPEHIEGKVNGTRIVLLSCFLKKV